MSKKIFFSILLFLLLADIGYSFLQHYYTSFDGDMAAGIVITKEVKPIFDSPLGFKVFMEDTIYPNPNKFFCHWSFYKYFNTAPLFLQNFTSPIDSAYLSCAIAKTIIQVAILFILAYGIVGNNFKFEIILAAVLITPLFQTNGYNNYMGIIDQSTTYVFFYALSIAFLLIYFFPLFYVEYYGEDIKGFKFVRILWIPFALVLSLSGPLNTGLALIISFLMLVNRLFNEFMYSKKINLIDRLKLVFRQIPKNYYLILLPICIFSIYSLFIGRYNSIDLSAKIPLATLYSRLPEGIYNLFAKKIGFPLLFIVVIINVIIIIKYFNEHEGKKIVKVFLWIGIFSIMYILLLPFGGYRDYRPNILRYDTMIPITLSLMFIFGKTTVFLFRSFSKKNNRYYVALIIFTLLVFTNADEPKFDKNSCEKEAILKIAQSVESIVRINPNCLVLSWILIENPKDSEIKTKLLKKWNIINEDKLYYQKVSIAK